MIVPLSHFENDQLRLQTISPMLLEPSRAVPKTMRSHKYRTPNDTIRQNMRTIKQNQRITQLKTVTQQNLKMFYRIRSQKSAYQLTELPKYRLKTCNTVNKIARAHSQVSLVVKKSQNNALWERCRSAQRLLKVNTPVLRNHEVQSKITFEQEKPEDCAKNSQKNTISVQWHRSQQKSVDSGKENNVKGQNIGSQIKRQEHMLQRKLRVNISIEKLWMGNKNVRKNLIICSQMPVDNSKTQQNKEKQINKNPLSERTYN